MFFLTVVLTKILAHAQSQHNNRALQMRGWSQSQQSGILPHTARAVTAAVSNRLYVVSAFERCGTEIWQHSSPLVPPTGCFDLTSQREHRPSCLCLHCPQSQLMSPYLTLTLAFPLCFMLCCHNCTFSEQQLKCEQVFPSVLSLLD